jgi:hypothetical protein
LNPLAGTPLEVRDVDSPKDPRIGGLAEATPPGKSEQLEELATSLLTVIGNGFVAGHARKHGDDGQSQQSGKGISLAPGTAWIMNAFKELHQR